MYGKLKIRKEFWDANYVCKSSLILSTSRKKFPSTCGFKFYKRNGIYDDLGYALALACFAAKQDGVKGVIIKV